MIGAFVPVLFAANIFECLLFFHSDFSRCRILVVRYVFGRSTFVKAKCKWEAIHNSASLFARYRVRGSVLRKLGVRICEGKVSKCYCSDAKYSNEAFHGNPLFFTSGVAFY
ncbi:hypothetical protein D3C75_916830 [compost metagenome]